MSNIQGHFDPSFARLHALFQEKLTSNEELGASLTVHIAGKPVLDLWGGHADAAKSTPWSQDTLVAVWSCTKVVSALAVLILIDRAQLDPDERVSKYWPDFANGKEDTRVWHLLSHSSGLPQWDKPTSMDEVYDTEASTAKLAAQAPWFEAGSASAYQLITHGHLLGGLVTRVSGRSLGEFIEAEITGPLGADFRLGLPREDWGRTAEIVPPPPVVFPDMDPEGVAMRAFTNVVTRAEDSASEGFRGSQAGAMNGFGNARALARIGDVVSLNGVVDGKRYLSAETVDRMLQESISGVDLVLFTKLRFGLGVALPEPESIAFIPPGKIGFWFGWGGSFLLMDVDRQMTIAYTMNKMGSQMLGNDNAEAYIRAIYEIVCDNGVFASL